MNKYYWETESLNRDNSQVYKFYPYPYINYDTLSPNKTFTEYRVKNGDLYSSILNSLSNKEDVGYLNGIGMEMEKEREREERERGKVREKEKVIDRKNKNPLYLPVFNSNNYVTRNFFTSPGNYDENYSTINLTSVKSFK